MSDDIMCIPSIKRIQAAVIKLLTALFRCVHPSLRNEAFEIPDLAG